MCPDYRACMAAPRRPLLAALCVVGVAVSVWATIVVFGQHYNQCDNEAGTCIRHRQLVAIVLIQAGAPIAAFIALAGCVLAVHRGRVPTLLVVAVVLATAVSAAVLVADPIPHLNDRWDGWLGKPIVDVPE